MTRSAARLPALFGLLTLLALDLGCTTREAIPEDALVVLLEARARTFDPRFATSDYDVKVTRLLFAGLVTTDTADGRPALELAESLDWITPTHLRVTLNDELRFHDGVPITSADVVYSYAGLANENVRSPFAGAFSDVEIQARGPKTVDFHLAHPDPVFINELDRGIVPTHLLEESGRFGDRPIVGSGAFALDSIHRDGTVVLRAAPTWHGGEPTLPAVVFRPVEDDNSRMLAMLSGAADLVLNATSPLMLPVVDRYDDLLIERSPSFKYTYLAFNLEHPILSDVRVRRAIAHALNREEIIETKFHGAAQLSTGMIAPNHWAWNPDVRRWDHDRAEALRLLDEAGYPPDATGCRMHLTFKTSANRFRRSVVEVMSSQLGAVGICTRVQAFEWGTFFDDIRSGNFEMTTLQWPSVLDPAMYEWVFHSRSIPTPDNRSSGGNRGRYASDDVDAWIDAARREMDDTERARIYDLVQERLAEDLPYVSLWHEENIVIRRQRVEGFSTTPNARFRHLETTRLID